MSPLELSCPECKCALRLPGTAAGKRVRCPKCTAVFTAPAAADASKTAAPLPPPVAAPLPPLPPLPPPRPTAKPVAKKEPPPPPPAPNPTDDDIFAKIATADDPVAAAAEARKPKPAAGEPGNPLPLDDDRPSRPRATPRPDKSAKGGTTGKPRPRRPARDDDDSDDRPRRGAGGLNPVWLLGGLAIVGALVLGIGVYAFLSYSDQKTDESAAAQREQEEAARRERDAAALAAKPKPQPQPQPPEPLKPQPAEPEPVKPEPMKSEPIKPQPVKPAPVDEGPPPPVFPPDMPRPPVVNPPFGFDPPPPPPGVVGPPGPPVKLPKIAFPPAAPVALKPAPLAEPRSEVKLPGVVTDACVGGGGRFWCLLMEDQRQVAVFDVNEAKVTKLLPVAAGKGRVAAGMSKLVVAHPDTGALTRFDLTTFEKELTAQAPATGFDSVAMGSASAGPLFVGSTPLDLATFKPFEPPARVTVGFGGWGDGMHNRVSPDGRVVGSWSTQFSPGGLNVTPVGPSAVKAFREHKAVGAVIPAADGVTVTAAGVYGPTGKKLAGPGEAFPRFPAQEGRFYLTGGTRPTAAYAAGASGVLVNLPEVALPAANEEWAKTDFLADKKVLFTTEGKLIAVLTPSADRLTLYKFDLDERLTQSGVDYLYVTGRPPAVEPGKRFVYLPAVKSKKGSVTVKLDAGPAGMTVAADGAVFWDVPAGFRDASVSVALTISDASGQEMPHTFTLPVAAK